MVAKKPESEKVANITPFGLRMPAALRDRIARAAKANGRSMNSEIVDLLSEHYPPDEEIDRLFEIVEEVMDEVSGNDSWRENRKTLLLWLGELKDRIKTEREIEARAGNAKAR